MSTSSASFRVWLLVVSIVLMGRGIDAGLVLMERQATASPSPTVNTAIEGNCSVAPSVCYLNTAYPIALQPGLPCNVINPHLSRCR
jgi:hypothetical protein